MFLLYVLPSLFCLYFQLVSDIESVQDISLSALQPNITTGTITEDPFSEIPDDEEETSKVVNQVPRFFTFCGFMGLVVISFSFLFQREISGLHGTNVVAQRENQRVVEEISAAIVTVLE